MKKKNVDDCVSHLAKRHEAQVWLSLCRQDLKRMREKFAGEIQKLENRIKGYEETSQKELRIAQGYTEEEYKSAMKILNGRI